MFHYLRICEDIFNEHHTIKEVMLHPTQAFQYLKYYLLFIPASILMNKAK